MNLNQQDQNVINTVSKKIVANNDTPPQTVAKRLNKFLKEQCFTEEHKLIIALLVFNGLFCINNNNFSQ